MAGVDYVFDTQIDTNTWTDIAISYSGRRVVAYIDGSVESKILQTHNVPQGDTIVLQQVGKFFHLIFWKEFMTADEIDECMFWIAPPLPEECPALELNVKLHGSTMFGTEVIGTADEMAIWFDEGLYLEGVNANFVNSKFSTIKS